MSRKPSLILIPGAWHTSDCFAPLVALLESQRYRCLSVNLPSKSSNSLVTLQDDIATVRRLIALEVSGGNHTIVVAHSYGGFVAASAVRDFTPNRTAINSTSIKTPGDVVGLILISSPFAQTGIDFAGGFQDAIARNLAPSPAFRPDPTTGFLVLTSDPHELFYNDLSPADAAFWVKRMNPQISRPFTEGGEYVYAGWKDVPVYYFITTNDRAFPVAMQRFFVQEAINDGADVTVREINTGHSPMISRPVETASLIREAVAWFTRHMG